jgi:histidine ammonia-lyase
LNSGAIKKFSAPGVAHDYVREFVSFAEEDRIYGEDINKVVGLIRDFSFVEKVNGFALSRKVDLNEGNEEFGL